jgi:hypothetical protein
MKKYFLNFLSVLLITILCGQTTNAQINNEETDLIQSIFGMEKKTIIADFIGLKNGDPFWAIYDEYEIKRKELGKERIQALTKYVENYNNLSNIQYDETIASMMSLQKRTDKLIGQYYKKIKKTSGSKIAAQFYQLEGYILTEIRAMIFDGIPMIGEFGN